VRFSCPCVSLRRRRFLRGGSSEGLRRLSNANKNWPSVDQQWTIHLPPRILSFTDSKRRRLLHPCFPFVSSPYSFMSVLRCATPWLSKPLLPPSNTIYIPYQRHYRSPLQTVAGCSEVYKRCAVVFLVALCARSVVGSRREIKGSSPGNTRGSWCRWGP
jgi:hypothetical protein